MYRTVKFLPTIYTCSKVSSRTKSSNVVDYSRNVKLYRQRTGAIKTSAPLVLFFPWLNASNSAVEKYRNLYHNHGLDVLVVQGELSHFLWPSKGDKMALDVINKLHSDELLKRDKYIVQGMSIGAFIYTMVLMNYSKSAGNFPGFPEKIRGQIFDSIVIGGLGKMANGIASSATENKFLQSAISSTAGIYFALTKKQTVDFYVEAVDYFYKMPVKCPSLVLYSHNDAMCDVDSMNHLLDTWRTDGRRLVKKSWTKSTHAGHLRQHPEEYLSVHSSFLKEIGVNTEQ